MAMQLGSGGDDEPMVEMNTTPLIDVMLVLLVMLIITIPIQMHAVQLDMPINTPQQPKPPEPPKVVKLWIEANGDVLWNGERVPDRNALEARLSEAAQSVPQPEFHIRPNKDCRYKEVAMVLTSAQRLGLQKLGVVGNEQFLDNGG